MTDRITRREFIEKAARDAAGIAIGGTGLALLGGAGCSRDTVGSEAILEGVAQADDPGALPNIVIILTDDLGYGDLGCFGSEAIKTPNLDRMATEGVKLTNFYASAPVCSPSRAGLLTGRYAVRSGVNTPLMNPRNPLGLGFNLISNTRPLPEDEITLPELLSRRGYATGMVGKWHLGNASPAIPNDRGFDSFYGVHWSNDINPFHLYRNRDREEAHPVDQSLLTTKYTKEAVSFIDAHAASPFFLYFSHTFPHIPLHASERFKGKSKGGLYGDTVEEIDWSVGEIFGALRRHGLDENTIVFFTSDNGPWYQGSRGPLRGRKRDVFEGGFRVPFIASWPGRIPAGRVSHEMSMNFDLFTTCLALAGVSPPNDRIIDGKDILPLLIGEGKTPHEALYFYFGDKLWAVRSGNWKYHRRHQLSAINPLPIPKKENRGPYLFDLATDRDESYNLTESHPDLAARFARILDEWDATLEANPRGWRRMN